MATIELSWTDNSTSEDGFRVYRSTASSPTFPSDYTKIAELSADTTSYTDNSPPAPGTIHYAVVAYDSTYGNSESTKDSIDSYGTVTVKGQTRRAINSVVTTAGQTVRNIFSGPVSESFQTVRDVYVIGIAKQFVAALGEVRQKEPALGEMEQKKPALGSTTNEDETDQQEVQG